MLPVTISPCVVLRMDTHTKYQSPCYSTPNMQKANLTLRYAVINKGEHVKVTCFHETMLNQQ